MGDSCRFEITVLKKDRDIIDKIMFDIHERCNWPEEEDNEDGTLTLVEYEANYGFQNQREELAKAGIIFYGYHGAGGCYGECVFACYNGHHVDASVVEYIPVALVNRDGSIHTNSLKNAQDYYQTLEQVEKYFLERIKA